MEEISMKDRFICLYSISGKNWNWKSDTEYKGQGYNIYENMS